MKLEDFLAPFKIVLMLADEVEENGSACSAFPFRVNARTAQL